MSKISYYSGRVQSVKFADEDKAFYIVKLVLDDEGDILGLLSGTTTAPVTVKGPVPGIPIKEGTWFGFEGKWVNHSQYGKQIEITRAPVLKGGWNPETASKMLIANGVGSGIMLSIRNHFADDTDFMAVLGDTSRLEDVPGLAKFSAQYVASRWVTVQAQFKALQFLNDLGLPPGRIKNVWSHFRDDAEEMLVHNPWRLVEVDGFTFQHADEVARKLGLVHEANQVKGAVLYACKSGLGFGHMYLQTGTIYHMVRSMVPDTEKEPIIQALADLYNEEKLVIDKKTRPGLTAVYEPWAYQMERDSAQLLLARAKAAAFDGDERAERAEKYVKALGSVGPLTEAVAHGTVDVEPVVRTAIEEWGSQAQLVLSDPQKEGIFNALTAPVSVLAGLPGTGKTTSLRAAVRILQDAGVPFLLCAPTGIAAKNLSARTGALASTIHRAFAAQGQSENARTRTYLGVVGDSQMASVGFSEDGWGYGPEHPHPADVVIIDEASMLDQHLLFRLLNCTKPDARLVFVGDYAQLPSVGPGNVLRDLINSGVFPTVKLTQIFRQGDTSGIVYAAHSMVNGRVPDTDKDFRLMQIEQEDKVLDAILRHAQRFYARRQNFQILSPKHGGTVGVTNLNERLRALLNPASPGLAEARFGNETVREGDRVMVIKNDYRLRLYNGDVGKVARVDRGKKIVQIVIFDDPPLYVDIDFKDVPKLLVLAYATTVHKAQGLEYDSIVMPLVRGFYHQLQRNLLYTAITRARKQVILLGHHDALVKAVNNAKEDDRATLFLDRLLGGSVP